MPGHQAREARRDRPPAVVFQRVNDVAQSAFVGSNGISLERLREPSHEAGVAAAATARQHAAQTAPSSGSSSTLPHAAHGGAISTDNTALTTRRTIREDSADTRDQART